MNKFIAFISTAAFVALPMVGYHNVFYYDGILHIVNRYDAGTIEADVTENHTNPYTGETNIAAAKANMNHIERFVTCVKSDGKACKATASKR